MSFEQIVAFNLALFAAIASPGPALLVAVQTTLNGGRRAGLAVGWGLGVMAAGWTLVALLGLEAVFEVFPWAYGAARIAGAAYLIYVAWSLWRGAGDPIASTRRPRRGAFRQGLLINLLNPKSVFFAAAVLIVIFPQDLSWLENTAVVANHLIVELLFYSALALGMSTTAVSRAYLRAKTRIDRVAAVLLAGLGLRLLSER